MGVGRVLTAVIVVCVLCVHPASAADPLQVYQEATEALYNLDFSKADKAFTELTQQSPDNPDYWNALASTVWLKILYDQQKLNMESFSGKDTFGTKESKDSVNPADEARLMSTVDKAIAAADPILKKNPSDIRGLYALGVANATLASYEGTVKRSYLSAARKAKTASNLHKQILKLDSNYHDARMAVGIYNYVVGSLPLVIRATLAFVRLGGDGKDVGIRDLEKAAAEGKRAATDAKMLLSVVYSRERRFEDTLKILDELHARYPRNFMFEMSKASVYGKMKRWDLAVQTFKQIAERVLGHQDGYDRMRLERVLYELGNSQIHATKFDEATATFTKIVGSSAATPNEKAGAHLWLGKMADSKKDRAAALRHYKAVQALDCDPGMKEEARTLERKPFV